MSDFITKVRWKGTRPAQLALRKAQLRMRYTGIMTSPVERLRSPRAGGAIAAARNFGVDLTLLIERLQRSPEQRLRDLQKAMKNLEAVRGAVSSSCDRLRESDPLTGRE